MVKDPQVGGHVIELLGRGSENNKDYWIVKNFWWTDWVMEDILGWLGEVTTVNWRKML